ncbi:hypothetical protein FQZ97_1057680 [compost metagenome]
MITVDHGRDTTQRPHLVASRAYAFAFLGHWNRELQRPTGEAHGQNTQRNLTAGQQLVGPDAKGICQFAPSGELRVTQLVATVEDIELQPRREGLAVGVPTGVAGQLSGRVQRVDVLEGNAAGLQHLAQALCQRFVVLARVNVQRQNDFQCVVEREAWRLRLKESPERAGACFIAQVRCRTRGGRGGQSGR